MQNKIIPPRSHAEQKAHEALLWLGLIVALVVWGFVFRNFAHAQPVETEGFESVGGLIDRGWTLRNQSQPGNNLIPSWFLGENAAWFAQPRKGESLPPFAGHGYLAANYRMTGGSSDVRGTICLWAISPTYTVSTGATELAFWSYSVWAHSYVDRLQVLLGNENAQPGVGLDMGDFYPILDINANYEEDQFTPDWARYAVWITTTQEQHLKFAFRYFVEDAGALGSRGNYIGIDHMTLASIAQVPEPSSWWLTGLLVPVVGYYGLIGRR